MRCIYLLTYLLKRFPFSVCAFAIAGPRLVHKITSDDNLLGVALLNSELFVLRDRRSSNQIDVYSTIDFTFLRHLSINSRKIMKSIAACPQRRVIYVLNESKYGVHRLGLDGSECMWPLTRYMDAGLDPLKLSVTRSTHILVLCIFIRDDHEELTQLQFLSSENGECVRTITVQVSADLMPYYCVELKEDQFLLTYCDGDEAVDPARIALLDGEGNIVQTTQDDVPMRLLSNMVVDSDQFVLACSIAARCVVLFDPMLNFVCNLTEGIELKPRSFVFDKFTRRLYVDEYYHDVSIVQL